MQEKGAARMDGIFISYRRDDSAGYAGRLYDRLAGHFGVQRVFMDVEGIEPGVDFVTAIEEAVSSCRVLIVIIGDEWTQAKDAAGRRRLDDPNDFIRLETGTALQRGIRVVPVLVEGASMPHIDDLPDDLKLLARRQAIEISHKQWESSTGELIRTLEGLLEGASPALPPDVLQATDSVSAMVVPTASGRRQRVWISTVVVLLALGATLWFVLWQRGVAELPIAPDTPLAAAVNLERSVVAEVAVKPDSMSTVGPTSAKLMPPASVPAPNPADVIAEAASEIDPAASAETPAEPVPVSKETEVARSAKIKPAVAEPLPEPIRPASPLPTPPPVITPVIRSFRAEVSSSVVRLCYRVSNADQLTLSPRPGELDKIDQDCVNTRLEQKTTFILAARNGDKTVRKSLVVEPEVRGVVTPEPVAPKTEPARDETSKVVVSSLPVKGERWVYRRSGKWPTSPRTVFEVTVQSSSADGGVSETMRAIEPASAFANQARESNGKRPGFISWIGNGIEFSPYFGAYTELERQESMSNIPTPDLDRIWQQWFSSAKVLGKESVSVPAGTFDTFKVEVWSNRHATGSQIDAGVEPVRVHYLVWYAQQAKRYVKMQRQISSASGIELERDVFELMSHRPP